MKKILMMMLVLAAFAPKTFAQTKMVGGAAMLPTRNIVENASKSKDHTNW